MQHIIVHGKNNLYPDLYLIILMIALELCWWWLLIKHSLCLPGRHLCSGVPVCNFSLSVLVVIYISCVLIVICVPVLCWWWFLIEHSVCLGRFLFECPGRHLYSLCAGFPVVICVPMFWSVISSVENMTSVNTQAWRHPTDPNTPRQLIFIYIDRLKKMKIEMEKS